VTPFSEGVACMISHRSYADNIAAEAYRSHILMKITQEKFHCSNNEVDLFAHFQGFTANFKNKASRRSELELSHYEVT
jgi:hypothetical protein